MTRADDGAELGAFGVGATGWSLGPGTPPDAVASGVRVNVSRAFDRPWRFWDPASAAVSAAKLHPAARLVDPGQASG